MTESKTELLTWLNDLLQIHYQKIEQCGSGAAYCQILDSIYGDVPLSKVKFASKHEYDYINNFKILQIGFNNHGIEKIIQIDKLVKCRYNDNLEFLQWMKKYWDAFYPGGGYDAAARRSAREQTAKVRERLRETQKEADSARSAGTKSLSSPTIKSTAAVTAASTAAHIARVREASLQRQKSNEDSLFLANIPVKLQKQGSQSSLASVNSKTRSTSANRVAPPGLVAKATYSSASAVTPINSNSAGEGKGRRTSIQNSSMVNSRAQSASSLVRIPTAPGIAKEPISEKSDSSSTENAKAPSPPLMPVAQHEAIVGGLEKRIGDLQVAADILERERNFYYLKLRDLEVIVLEKLEKGDSTMIHFLREVQAILYSTEEGFVSPRREMPPSTIAGSEYSDEDVATINISLVNAPETANDAFSDLPAQDALNVVAEEPPVALSSSRTATPPPTKPKSSSPDPAPTHPSPPRENNRTLSGASSPQRQGSVRSSVSAKNTSSPTPTSQTPTNGNSRTPTVGNSRPASSGRSQVHHAKSVIRVEDSPVLEPQQQESQPLPPPNPDQYETLSHPVDDVPMDRSPATRSKNSSSELVEVSERQSSTSRMKEKSLESLPVADHAATLTSVEANDITVTAKDTTSPLLPTDAQSQPKNEEQEQQEERQLEQPEYEQHREEPNGEQSEPAQSEPALLKKLPSSVASSSTLLHSSVDTITQRLPQQQPKTGTSFPDLVKTLPMLPKSERESQQSIFIDESSGNGGAGSIPSSERQSIKKGSRPGSSGVVNRSSVILPPL